MHLNREADGASLVQQLASRDIVQAAQQMQQAAYYTLYAGQGVGMIEDIPSAADIVRSVVAEAREAIARAGTHVTLEAGV